MNAPLDLTGTRFGKLVATARRPPGGRKSTWLCRCDCGREIEAFTTNLSRGTSRSCGCSKVKHGLTGHYLFATHASILHRCYQPAARKYADYGGRGIRLADELRDVADFVRLVLEALGDRPQGMSLDRENNDGHYEIGNLRWATSTQQNRNRRNLRINSKGTT